MVPFSIDLVQSIGLSILQIMNRYSFRAKMYFVAALINVVTTIIMTQYFGIVGAAFSTGVTMLITSGFILNWYYSKVGLQIRKFWLNIGSIFIKVMPYAILMYFVNLKLGNAFSGMLGLTLKILAYTLGFLLILYIFALNLDEQKFIKKYLYKIKGSF